MKCEDDANRGPEPGKFPQSPLKLDGKQDHPEDDVDRESHLRLAQINEKKENGHKAEANFRSSSVGRRSPFGFF